MIKSPLRYPGGKSKALKWIVPLIPYFDELREPFVGGGSVFVVTKQLFPSKKFWINDLNQDLYSFWKVVRDDIKKLVIDISKLKNDTSDGKFLHKHYTKSTVKFNEFEKAVRFFVLNRITFSGTADSGGFSKAAFEKRFTKSSIDRLNDLGKIVTPDVRITNIDYEELVNKPGENVFIFLDPPYLTAEKSMLYGKNGNLHRGFDHQRFANVMKNCQHKWLITYDDHPEIRNLFKFANIIEWEMQYGMNNYKKTTAAKGKELFIANYPIKLDKQLDFGLIGEKNV